MGASHTGNYMEGAEEGLPEALRRKAPTNLSSQTPTCEAVTG